MAKKVSSPLQITPNNDFTIKDTNRITARNLLVQGNIHVSCDISLKSYPRTEELMKECENLAETLTITGDLYIQAEQVNCQNAILSANLDDYKSGDNKISEPFIYDDLIINKSETFKEKLNTSINNVYLDAKEVRLYGKLVTEKDIFIYDDNVFNKIRSAKIEHLKTNIKK